VLVVGPHEHGHQPIVLSEFGGVALEDPDTWGYSYGSSPAELRERYCELLAVVHALPMLAGFCYTQFADTYQEANGLLHADRQPKFDLQVMARATRGPGRKRD
jgi:hypothetical protein